jgi:hypothetical protein
MDFNLLSSLWASIRRGMTRAKARNQDAYLGIPSFYRYDSTGRIVHYGPEGEVLEYDSAFQITGVHYKRAVKSISASKRIDPLPQ